ncbi:biotin carboxyl carrier protein of acetyl-CoA carboxylase 2, chloroplastic-like [Mercurialis annua]|uniref:biotin carboxyl carrier protein of acetyl-CoA carboxylase 2, chloroplastic-like n=1 Tax=Mercurialis annua TaxID=3986 RepID=UPI00215EC0C4|nr:biotin carboxyl carrier protein of acetyl-CoA carboxylase 2, chloroplastic-like [Mercurialis annua]
MASTSVPCPKTSFVSRIGSNASNPFPKHTVSFPSRGFQWPNRKQSSVAKVKAQLNEVIFKESSNSIPVLESNSKAAPSEVKDESVVKNVPDASTIAAFMAQVSDLVKLVDSRDINELQLKQSDCELIIRKKEALQPPPAAQGFAMPPYYQQAVFPPPPAAVSTPAPTAAPPASAPALPSPANAPAPKSSHPPFKCPMAGTFYRCPGPGEPAFVKIGDKVQKGQVICIIEAMKLMNEIEADQSGTIAEILVDDAKPVSVDTPLFVIVP